MFRIRNLICVFIAAVSLFSLSSCEFKPAIAVGLPDPQEALNEFFTDVCAGDFEKADRYLDGVSLRMKGNFSGPFSESLYAYLLKSFRFDPIDNVDSHLTKADCKVVFTCLDPALLADDLKTLTTTLGKAHIASGDKDYLEEKDGRLTLSDAGAEKTAVEALDELMKTPKKYDSTHTYDISMSYSDGRWIITLPDELYEAMSCGFNRK